MERAFLRNSLLGIVHLSHSSPPLLCIFRLHMFCAHIRNTDAGKQLRVGPRRETCAQWSLV